MPKKEDKIYEVLSQIEKSLQKQNSTKYVFTQGLARGLGTALGATVLLAILTSLAIQLSSTFDMRSLFDFFFNVATVD